MQWLRPNERFIGELEIESVEIAHLELGHSNGMRIGGSGHSPDSHTSYNDQEVAEQWDVNLTRPS